MAASAQVLFIPILVAMPECMIQDPTRSFPGAISHQPSKYLIAKIKQLIGVDIRCCKGEISNCLKFPAKISTELSEEFPKNGCVQMEKRS